MGEAGHRRPEVLRLQVPEPSGTHKSRGRKQVRCGGSDGCVGGDSPGLVVSTWDQAALRWHSAVDVLNVAK